MRLDESKTVSDAREALACCAALDAARALDRAGQLVAAAAQLADVDGCDSCRFRNLYLKGSLAARLGNHAEADRWLSAALGLDPGSVPALRLHGIVLRRLGRLDAALERYEAAIALAPDAAETHVNLANLLNDLQRWRDGLRAADRALALDPAAGGAHNARGTALAGLGSQAQATVAFREAIRLEPGDVNAHVNLGNALVRAGQIVEALALYERATSLAPGAGGAWNGLGNALALQERWTEAAEAYDRSYAIDPGQAGLLGQRLHARMKLCDWRDYHASATAISRELRRGRLPTGPFPLLAISDSAADQRLCAEAYVRGFVSGPVAPRPAPAPSSRIRVGYFSADFHYHATAHLMAEVFEQHDRDAFEITAFSFGPSSDDPMRRRLLGAFERFFDISGMDDAAAASMGRAFGLDIAVDLKGFTKEARAGIFRHRPAPVQVNYLGYPGTMGAPFIDYLIADPVLVPPSSRGDYSEKIAYLPWTYQPNDRQRPRPPRTTHRDDHGLPPNAFVFGGFNALYKVTPDVFVAWMRILAACEDSVLWLYGDHPVAVHNVRREAERQGVDPRRLVFADPAPRERHLERLQHLDLFLDTAPYNAHTTASDALWMDVPLVTKLGGAFAGRVAASLLAAAGASDLVAESWAAYEALAIDLFRDPGRLAAIRERLARDRLAKPIFDTPRYTRDLEALYRRMHERRLADLPPEHLPPVG